MGGAVLQGMSGQSYKMNVIYLAKKEIKKYDRFQIGHSHSLGSLPCRTAPAPNHGKEGQGGLVM